MINRKCRRKHQDHWKTKVLSDNRRLVVCQLCGGTDTEWRVKPDASQRN